MYRWDLVEGKDSSKELVSPEFESGPLTSTMALVWRITKPVWVTGKMVIMESGLCVLKGFIGMYERGVFGSSVTKKRIYWQSGINEDQIEANVFE